MAVVTISEADLDTWLGNQPANTVDTPYELKITPDNNSDIKFILDRHPTKYVDIRETFLYSSEHLCNFKNCLTLIGAPKCQSPSSKPVFEGCTNLKYASAVSWDNLDNIFKNCTSLIDAGNVFNSRFNGTSTLHGTSMVSTFEGCEKLKTVVIKDTTNALTDLTNAFKGCSSLEESPTLSTSITNLSYTFRDCSSLESAPTIPSTVTNMTGTFMACSSLVSAPTIPSNVTNMGYCFSDCTSLVNTPVIPNGVTDISYCFSGCTSLVNAPVIPNSVTSMSQCFDGCTSLTTAPDIPNGVTNIYRCFANCNSLMNAPTIPNSITNIEGCFYKCTALENSPIIPSGVTNMYGVFEGCSALLNAPIIPDTVTSMNGTFVDCTSLLYKPIIPSSVTTSAYCYRNVTQERWGGSTSQLETFVSSQTTEFDIVEIEADTENNCYEMTGREVYGVDISNLDTWLSNKDVNTVNTPYEIKVLNITENNRTLLRTALRNNSVKYVDIGYTILTAIILGSTPIQTLSMCNSLVGAPTFAEGITTLSQTFDSCANLKKVPALPSTLTLIQSVFAFCTSLVTPPVIPANVTDINNLFRGCTALTSAPEIPNGVTRMPYTFTNCASLRNPPEIPNSVTEIAGCFSGCYTLGSAPDLPTGITSLLRTFENCLLIKTPPVIPSTVTNMESTFEGCSALKYAPSIPSGVTTVKNCFNGCAFIANSFEGVTTSGIAIYHGENYSTGSVSTATVPTVGSISKDFGSSLANSCNNLDFKNNEYKQSDGYTLSDNVVAYRYSFYPYGIPEKTRVYLVKNLTTQKKYLFGIINYFTPAFFFINIDSINVDNLGFVLISDEDFVEIMPRYGGRVFSIYSDSTETVDITATHFGDWNLSHSFETIADDWLAIGDNFYIDWDVSDNVSSSGYDNECNGTYEVLLNDVILQSTAGIDYVRTTPAIVLPSSVTNAEGCFQGCNHLETIAKIPSSVTNVKNCFDGCTNLRKIDNFQVALSVLDSANAQDCFKNCSSLIQVGFKINEAEYWHIWKLTYGSDTVEGKIYDADGTSVTIPQTSITKTDLQLPNLTDELWFPNETDNDIEAIIQKILTYKYGVFKKEVLPPDEKSFVLIADNPNNVVSNILENSKVTITSSRSLSISKDTRAIISGENITLTLPATGSTNGSILELFTTNDTSIVYYADSNTSATQTMEADSRILFVYYNGWRFVGTYGAVWN